MFQTCSCRSRTSKKMISKYCKLKMGGGEKGDRSQSCQRKYRLTTDKSMFKRIKGDKKKLRTLLQL